MVGGRWSVVGGRWEREDCRLRIVDCGLWIAYDASSTIYDLLSAICGRLEHRTSNFEHPLSTIHYPISAIPPGFPWRSWRLGGENHLLAPSSAATGRAARTRPRRFPPWHPLRPTAHPQDRPCVPAGTVARIPPKPHTPNTPAWLRPAAA